VKRRSFLKLFGAAAAIPVADKLGAVEQDVKQIIADAYDVKPKEIITELAGDGELRLSQAVSFTTNFDHNLSSVGRRTGMSHPGRFDLSIQGSFYLSAIEHQQIMDLPILTLINDVPEFQEALPLRMKAVPVSGSINVTGYDRDIFCDLDLRIIK